jgi:hypothetical protein
MISLSLPWANLAKAGHPLVPRGVTKAPQGAETKAAQKLIQGHGVAKMAHH